MIALIERGPSVSAHSETARTGAATRGHEWYDSVQGLRAIAMTLVFANHLAFLLQGRVEGGGPEAVRSFSSFGTDLFFCIAGAFVYRNLVREETAYWVFVRKRIRRVYPVYAFVLLLYAALEAVFRTGRLAGVSVLPELLRNALLLPPLLGETPIVDASWALSYIVVFYLISPALFEPVRRLDPAKRPAALAALLALGIGVSVVTGICPLRVTLLLAGPLVWSLRRVRIHWLPLVALAVCGLMLRTADPTLGALRFCGSLAAAMAILLGAMGGVPSWQRPLSLKPVTALGYRSYSFYLCHGLPLLAFDRYLFAKLAGWELALAASASWLGALAFTEVAHRCIEIPLSLRNKSRENCGRVQQEAGGGMPPGFAAARPIA